MDFFSMRRQDVEAMAERHYNRLLDEYLREDPEPFETDKPDWTDIVDLVDVKYSRKQLADILRDYIESDGEVMDEIYRAGLLDQYIPPEDNWKQKDPDDEWDLIQAVFAAQWENEDLFIEIYKWLPDEHLQKLGENLLKNADSNGIRDLYNDAHQDDWRYNPYEDD